MTNRHLNLKYRFQGRRTAGAGGARRAAGGGRRSLGGRGRRNSDDNGINAIRFYSLYYHRQHHKVRKTNQANSLESRSKAVDDESEETLEWPVIVEEETPPL